MARLKSTVVDVVTGAIGSDDFVIVELTKDGPVPVYDGDGQLLKFDTGAKAAKKAALMCVPGRKFQPRRVQDDKWQDRERTRFTTKEYQELPWAQDRWWRSHGHIHGAHFPHVSTKNSVGLMAFTEDEKKGSADIQTAIKPGKYLERYFSSVLDPFIIRDLCTAFSAKFEDNVLIFGETEDDFEMLYTTGPSSCMSHAIDKYLSPIHPVRVYAAGDLKLAYMKRDGRIVARTLVYPDKKKYNRIYGDSGRIQPLLRAAGYNEGAPGGAKLQRVIAHQNKKAKTGNTAFVCPHIDNCSYVLDKGDHLVIVDPGVAKPKDAIAFSGATGITEWVSLCCHGCGKESGKADMVAVIINNDGQHQKFCPECVADPRKVVKCGFSGNLVMLERTVAMADGSRWWALEFANRGFTCSGNGLNYSNKERITVVSGARNRRSAYYSKAYYEANGGHKCKDCGHHLIKPCTAECGNEYRTNVERQQAMYTSGTAQTTAYYQQAIGSAGILAGGWGDPPPPPPIRRR